MKLCIYGAGGFGKEVYDVAKRMNEIESMWDEILFIDDASDLGSTPYLGRVLSFEDLLQSFDHNVLEVVIAIGEPITRKSLFNKVESRGLKFAAVIDPSSIISPTAKIGFGVIVAPYCSISSSAVLGDNVAVNTHSIVGHDISIGDNAVISSFVNIGGGCSVGEDSYLGMGALIKEKVTIGSQAIVGMGSVVHKNIPDKIIAMGNPARPIRRNENQMVFNR